jgi:hypothetical protein
MAAWAKLKSDRRTNAVTWGVSFAVLGSSAGLVFGIIGAVVGASMLGLAAAQVAGKIRARHYYGIPGSRDARGEHRCIHCGNKGIYRKGKYKTDNVYANCSKCQHFLFQE